MENGKSLYKTVGTIIVIGLLIAVAIYYATTKIGISDESAGGNDFPLSENAQTLRVTAENDAFNPSEIRTQIQHDINLEIAAEDKDYIFRIEDYPRFDTEIKKGETKVVKLYYLGVGEYEYTCGAGCSGKVVVEQTSDPDIED